MSIGSGDGVSDLEDEPRAKAVELVLAIAHEVGNLAAAMRIQAHLVADSRAPTELAAAAVAIGELSAQQDAWLGLLHPLLDEGTQGLAGSPQSSVLHAARTLRESGRQSVQIETSAPSNLPRVPAPPELLDRLVSLLAHAAAGAARPDGLVQLSAEASEGGVVFRFIDGGPGDPELADWRCGAYRGRVLCCVVVDHLVGPLGGRLSVERRDERTRIALWLPALVRLS